MADKKYNLRGSKKEKNKGKKKSDGLFKEYINKADITLNTFDRFEDETEIEQNKKNE
jgi:hypothetical protein